MSKTVDKKAKWWEKVSKQQLKAEEQQMKVSTTVAKMIEVAKINIS